ncbi:hypothetical protein CF326_g4235 [Tilletia indica]|nr:hypothetical protein CF326_g4235 [Tilletia indica]
MPNPPPAATSQASSSSSTASRPPKQRIIIPNTSPLKSKGRKATSLTVAIANPPSSPTPEIPSSPTTPQASESRSISKSRNMAPGTRSKASLSEEEISFIMSLDDESISLHPIVRRLDRSVAHYATRVAELETQPSSIETMSIIPIGGPLINPQPTDLTDEEKEKCFWNLSSVQKTFGKSAANVEWNKILVWRDGKPISKDEYNTITARAKQIVRAEWFTRPLPTQLKGLPPPHKTLLWFKRWEGVMVHTSKMTLTIENPILQLCANEWKAEIILGKEVRSMIKHLNAINPNIKQEEGNDEEDALPEHEDEPEPKNNLTSSKQAANSTTQTTSPITTQVVNTSKPTKPTHPAKPKPRLSLESASRSSTTHNAKMPPPPGATKPSSTTSLNPTPTPTKARFSTITTKAPPNLSTSTPKPSISSKPATTSDNPQPPNTTSQTTANPSAQPTTSDLSKTHLPSSSDTEHPTLPGQGTVTLRIADGTPSSSSSEQSQPTSIPTEPATQPEPFPILSSDPSDPLTQTHQNTPAEDIETGATSKEPVLSSQPIQLDADTTASASGSGTQHEDTIPLNPIPRKAMTDIIKARDITIPPRASAASIMVKLREANKKRPLSKLELTTIGDINLDAEEPTTLTLTLTPIRPSIDSSTTIPPRRPHTTVSQTTFSALAARQESLSKCVRHQSIDLIKVYKVT